MAGTSRDAGDGSERGPDDVPIYPNAKNRPAIRQPGFDIGRCLRIGTRTERVLVIGEHGDIGDPGAPQRIDERIDGSRSPRVASASASRAQSAFHRFESDGPWRGGSLNRDNRSPP